MTEQKDQAGNSGYFGKDYFSAGNYFHGYESYGGRGFWASVLRSIEKYVPDSKQRKFLDVGSAFGFLLKHELGFQNVSVFGVDISKYALIKSKSVASGAGLVEVNIDKSVLPFPNNTFECVTALDVAEHLHDFDGAVKDFARVLKSNGLLIIGTPVTDTWEGKIWDKYDQDKSHVSKPTREKLFNTLKQTGFEILESKYYFPLPWLKIPFPRTNMEVVARKI